MCLSDRFHSRGGYDNNNRRRGVAEAIRSSSDKNTRHTRKISAARELSLPKDYANTYFKQPQRTAWTPFELDETADEFLDFNFFDHRPKPVYRKQCTQVDNSH